MHKTHGSDWDPSLYLKFKNERTQPSIDLASRINLENPRRIIDIGCGPGNSTQVLVHRWPQCEITGLDNSPAMIEKAMLDYPQQKWQLGDALSVDPSDRYDIVFSNAVIQWIPGHENLVKNLFSIVEDGGALALQVPRFSDMALGHIIEDVSGRERWSSQMSGCSDLFTYNTSGFYYDLLSPCACLMDIWETSYIHIMDSYEAIIDWSRSTALKPYLDRLETAEMKLNFEQDILDEIKREYTLQRNGKVLFPFYRLFFVAYR